MPSLMLFRCVALEEDTYEELVEERGGEGGWKDRSKCSAANLWDREEQSKGGWVSHRKEAELTDLYLHARTHGLVARSSWWKKSYEKGGPASQGENSGPTTGAGFSIADIAGLSCLCAYVRVRAIAIRAGVRT